MESGKEDAQVSLGLAYKDDKDDKSDMDDKDKAFSQEMRLLACSGRRASGWLMETGGECPTSLPGRLVHSCGFQPKRALAQQARSIQ